MEYYFKILDDGEAIVMCIAEDGSYSQHSSNDESAGQGDGSTCQYDWHDAQAWSPCTREKANEMLRFNFDDNGEDADQRQSDLYLVVALTDHGHLYEVPVTDATAVVQF